MHLSHVILVPSKTKTLETLIETYHQITYRNIRSVCPDYLANHVPQGFINYSCWESKALISITSSASTPLKSIPGHTFIDQWPGALPNNVPTQRWNVFFHMWQSWWGCASCCCTVCLRSDTLGLYGGPSVQTDYLSSGWELQRSGSCSLVIYYFVSMCLWGL